VKRRSDVEWDVVGTSKVSAGLPSRQSLRKEAVGSSTSMSAG